MELITGAWLVFKKDIRYELENKETLIILFVFSLTVALTFNFAFDLSRTEARRFLPGLIWITALFASVLGFNKSMAFEKRGDAYGGLLIAPIPKTSIFLGKVSSSLVFLWAVEMVVIPLFFLFFNVELSAKIFGFLVIVFLLGSVGLSVIGSFLTNLCQGSKNSEILFSLGYFPLVVPILISGTKLSAGILDGKSIVAGPWVKLLIIFGLVYTVICLLLFEYLVEE
ncbi:MAG: heme exporter protein CcmB [Candidatus Bipolaricaulia bacterium]